MSGPRPPRMSAAAPTPRLAMRASQRQATAWASATRAVAVRKAVAALTARAARGRRGRRGRRAARGVRRRARTVAAEPPLRVSTPRPVRLLHAAPGRLCRARTARRLDLPHRHRHRRALRALPTGARPRVVRRCGIAPQPHPRRGDERAGGAPRLRRRPRPQGPQLARGGRARALRRARGGGGAAWPRH